MSNLWEFGILLIGIGFLVVCIYVAISISNFTKVLMSICKNIDGNEKDLKIIVSNVSEISTNLNKLCSIGNSFAGFFSIFKIFRKITKRK